MKFITGTVAFLFSSSLACASAQSPPAMMACRDSASITDFATCFVSHANPVCVDESTVESVQACVAALDPAPEDIRGLMSSGCFDSIKECLKANAPERGEMGFGARIPPPIMEECQASETIAAFVDCVVSNADLACVDESTLSEITTCIANLETPPEDIRDLLKNSGCFDTISECMKEQVEEFMSTLPECLPETMGALGECIRENKAECMESCSGASVPILDIDNLETCAGFQEQVMGPLCTTISCCGSCVESFQDAAACVVAEYLAVEDCEFDCPVARRSRELMFERIKKWFGNKGGSSEGPSNGGGQGDRPERPAFGECLDVLRLASDIDTVTEEDVAEFLECLSGHYLEVIAREPKEGRPASGLRGDGRGGI